MKAFDFPGAVAEMKHFGMEPAIPFAIAVIVLELGASAMILVGKWRWLAALALAGFTGMATFLANRYWELAGQERAMMMNAFYEHIGLVGGFVLVAFHDLTQQRKS